MESVTIEVNLYGLGVRDWRTKEAERIPSQRWAADYGLLYLAHPSPIQLTLRPLYGHGAALYRVFIENVQLGEYEDWWTGRVSLDIDGQPMGTNRPFMVYVGEVTDFSTMLMRFGGSNQWLRDERGEEAAAHPVWMLGIRRSL